MIDDTINKNTEELNNDKDIIDVKLDFVEKKRFRFEGDYNRMLELNVSDLNVFARLKNGYPKLQTLFQEARQKIEEIPDNGEGQLDALADTLTYIDQEMRSLIDEIFDADVSRVVAPSGNMFDPVGGQYRFEKVLDIVTKLYTNGLNAEFNKVKNRISKHRAEIEKS